MPWCFLILQQRGDVDIAVFADEHMVEMNRRSSGHHSLRRRPRSPSPMPPRISKSPAPPLPSSSSSSPSSNPSPSPSSSNTNQVAEPAEQRGAEGMSMSAKEVLGLNSISRNGRTLSSIGIAPLNSNSVLQEGRTLKKEARSSENRTQHAEGGTANASSDSVAAAPESNLPLPPPPPTSAPSSLAPAPFQSQPLISMTVTEPKNSTKSPLDRLQQTRKRERTPSPTPGGGGGGAGLPPAKRPALVPAADSTSTLKPGGHSQNHTLKPPSPLPGARLGKPPELSSASKVLGEEIQRQQGQENARLRALIIKEVRKPGKSELRCVQWVGTGPLWGVWPAICNNPM